MKILIVFMSFPSISETFACSDIRGLLKAGIDLRVISLRPSKLRKNYDFLHSRQIPEKIFFEHTFIAFISFTGFVFRRFWLVYYLLKPIAKELLRSPSDAIKEIILLPSVFYSLFLIKKFSPEVVHLYWGHYTSLLGIIIKACYPCIKLTTFLGAYDLFKNLEITKIFTPQADILYTHSNENLKLLKSFSVSNKKIQVIHRGVDLSYFSQINSYKKNANTFMTASRLIKQKNVDKSLEVFSRLSEKYIFSIAGGGPCFQELNNIAYELGIDSRCNFLGFLDQKKLFTEMCKSRFFMLLSTKKGECIPNVVKEAMLAGCICFVMPSPGIGELIVDQVNGFILDENYLLKIPDIVENLSVSKISEISIAAESTILDHFSLDLSISKYLNAWKSLFN